MSSPRPIVLLMLAVAILYSVFMSLLALLGVRNSLPRACVQPG